MALNKLQSFLLSVPFFRFTPIGKKWIEKEEEVLKQRLQNLKGSHFTFKSLNANSFWSSGVVSRRLGGTISYFLVNRVGRLERFSYYTGLPIPLPTDPTACCYYFNNRSDNFNEERFKVLMGLCKKFDEQRVVFSVRGADSINALLEDKDNLIEATLSYTDPETREQITICL